MTAIEKSIEDIRTKFELMQSDITGMQERIEEKEVVHHNLINTVSELEKGKVEFPEIKVPDHTGELQLIKEKMKLVKDSLDDFNRRYNVLFNDLTRKFDELNHLTGSIPKEIPVRHHHHFDLRSRGFIIGAMILLLTTFISSGFLFSLWSQNKGLHENSLKFRMIRQGYPAVSIWADSTYDFDPEKAEQTTLKLEAQKEAAVQAELPPVKRKIKDGKARKKANKLKKK